MTQAVKVCASKQPLSISDSDADDVLTLAAEVTIKQTQTLQDLPFQN